jgi:hypothetical protein
MQEVYKKLIDVQGPKKEKRWELTIGHGEQGNESLLVSTQSSL